MYNNMCNCAYYFILNQINLIINNIKILTLANISRPTEVLGETFITRLWDEFIFMANSKVFLNFKSISVQLLLYNPKFILDFYENHKIKYFNTYVIIIGRIKLNVYRSFNVVESVTTNIELKSKRYYSADKF